MWSMREQKKSSVAGQANITAELPEISRYWISNWEFAPSAITPERQCLCGLWGGCSGATKYRGLAKNTANLMTLFALSILWLAQRSSAFCMEFRGKCVRYRAQAPRQG